MLSPNSQRQTVADLAVSLELPLVLVAANRLGCVSHVLAAAEVIAARKLKLSAVLLNRLPDRSLTGEAQSPDLSLESNLGLIRQFLPKIPVVELAEELQSYLDDVILAR